MRFKLDENVPRAVVELLRNAGQDVETVLEEGLGGTNDTKLIEACRAESRTLVTLDLDFADVRRYPPARFDGIWVLRPPHQDVPQLVSAVQGALSLLPTEPVAGRLWIVERNRVRVRE